MAEPLARATFATTLRELADVATRDARRWRSAGARRAAEIAGVAVLVGIAVTGLLLALTRPLDLEGHHVASGTTMAVVMFLAHELTRPLEERSRARDELRRRLGAGPFAVAVELHAELVLVRQAGTELRVPWVEITAITEELGDVVLQARATLVVVRERAFAGAAPRAQFLATAHELRRRACEPAAAPAAPALQGIGAP